MKNPSTTFIRKSEVQRRTGLSDTTIWRLEKEDKFPKRVQIHGKIVGWVESEVTAWLQARLDEREAA